MLFLRGLRWRRGFSVAVLVVGMISAAVAAIGPLYARAASESTLTDELRSAGSRAGLAFTDTTLANNPNGVRDATRRVGSAGPLPGFGPPIRGESTVITAKAAANAASTPSTLVWRGDQCAHLVLTAGRCATGTGEVMVPDETAHSDLRWTLGQSLVVHQGVVAPDGVVDGLFISRVRVVGTYRPRDFAEAFWFGLPYFASQLGPAVNSVVRIGADAIFTGPGTFLRAPGPSADQLPVTKEIDVDVPLVAAHVRLDDVARVRRDVAAVQRRFPRQSATPGTPSMRTFLNSVLADAARDKRQVQNATLVVVLELAALSLLVLFQVVGGAVASRGDEIALAKLRGLPPRRTIVFALGEPLALLLVAAPLGFLLAFVVTHLLASSALVGGTPVLVTAATGWALAAAFAGGAVAAVLAAVATVTRPVLEQWRTTAPKRHGTRWLLVLDLVLAAVAAATVVALRTGAADRPKAIFLLAPALLVFAVALVGVRLLPRVARLGLRPTRSSTRLAWFLALRQTVRRPGGLRLAALLAVAAGLAIFAVCGEAVARSNRSARAQTEIGTAKQVAVQFESGHDPQGIVDAVDPHGRWAMAAATWTPDGGPSSGHTVVGQLLGVEPARLPATSYRVRGQASPARIAADITSATTSPPAAFRGTRLQVILDTTALVGDHPTVELEVRRPHALATPVPAGTLRTGRHTYTATVDCAAGCTFAGLIVDRTIDAQDVVTGTTVLESLAAGTASRVAPVTLPLARVASWRGGQIGYGSTVRTSSDGSALTVTFRSSGGGSPVLVYADSPTVVPIVAAPAATATPAASGGVNDYTGTSITYRVVRRTSPLPVMLDTGAVADLDYLRLRLPNFDRESGWTVWIGPHAPADAVARLERAGLLVQNVRTESARVAALGRQGPALGLLLLFVCAIAAAVLAVGGTAITLLADSRRRMFEMAALRVVGVPHRTLRRSAVAEQALLLGAAIVLGLPSGYAAAALVLPVVPEFSDHTPVVLRYSPPVLLALAYAAAFAVLLGVTALIAGRALARAAVPARLREAAR